MDVKEKLVELLCKVQDYGTKITREGWSVTVASKDNKTIADHLIAHGVTVQEWISVKDRLPEPFEEVLVYDHTGKSINYAYMTRHHEWVGAIMSHVVTHWMPLPQPPKGE